MIDTSKDRATLSRQARLLQLIAEGIAHISAFVKRPLPEGVTRNEDGGWWEVQVDLSQQPSEEARDYVSRAQQLHESFSEVLTDITDSAARYFEATRSLPADPSTALQRLALHADEHERSVTRLYHIRNELRDLEDGIGPLMHEAMLARGEATAQAGNPDALERASHAGNRYSVHNESVKLQRRELDDAELDMDMRRVRVHTSLGMLRAACLIAQPLIAGNASAIFAGAPSMQETASAATPA